MFALSLPHLLWENLLFTVDQQRRRCSEAHRRLGWSQMRGEVGGARGDGARRLVAEFLTRQLKQQDQMAVGGDVFRWFSLSGRRCSLIAAPPSA